VTSLRISATTLESFHLYRTTEWMTEARFIKELGEFEDNPQMKRGRAFEEILRRPRKYVVPDGYACEGVFFPEGIIKRALPRIPEDVIWQAKVTKVYDVDGEPVTVICKTDGLLGRVILEIKTTESFDLDKYQGSRQWRLYLDSFGADLCRYIVFEIRESKRDGSLYMPDVHEFEVYPYPGMRGDVLDDLTALVRFIRLRGLENYFEPKEEGAWV